MSAQWTKPFHGVQHLGQEPGAFSLGKRWASVCDWGTWADLRQWFPGCGFSPIEKTFDNVKEARKAGERWVRGES